MTIEKILEALDLKATEWEAEAKGYMRQAGVVVGSQPADTTPEQTGCAYSAGSYSTYAHQLRELIKHTRWEIKK